MGNVALTFPNTAGTDSNGDLTTDGGWDWPDQQTNINTKDGGHRRNSVNEIANKNIFFAGPQLQ